MPACQITTCRTLSSVFRRKKKVGTRTTGGAVLAAALESASAQQKQKQVYVAAVCTDSRDRGPGGISSKNFPW